MRRSNVKSSYIISYSAIMLIVLVLAATALVSYGMTSLKSAMEREQRERAELAAADLEAQMDSFQQIRSRIKTSYVFQPAYQRRAYTRRLELIELLNSYENDLLIDAQMYLYCARDGEIYFDKTCADWETLCRIYWKLEPDEALHSALLESAECSAFRHPSLPDVLISLPFTMGPTENRERMVLFFRIAPEKLQERLLRVSGLQGDEYSVSFGGRWLLGAEGCEWYTVVSDSGEFELGLAGIPDEARASLSRIQNMMLLLCAIFVVLSLAAATWIGKRQYRPIATMHRRLGGNEEGNELAYIEQTISETLRENDRVKRDILSQMDSLMNQSEIIEHQADKLRRQLVMLLLLGVYRSEQEIPDELTMMFRHPRFAVLSIRGCGESQGIEIVEQCLDERWILFAVPITNQSRLAVLANLTDHDDLFDLVTQLGRRLGAGAAIYSSAVIDLSEVGVSFIQCSGGARPPEGDYINDFLLGQGCRELFQAVRIGDREAALSRVSELRTSLPKEQLPVIELRRIYLALLKKLQNLAEELDCAIDEKHASALMLSLTPEQFEGNLAICVADLCGEEAQEERPPESAESIRLLAYIDEHACESDMSLPKLEDELGLSRKRITAAVKQMTNMGFREYVVYQRIERAKLLLLNTKLSISAIAEMCGYDSPSYFIKSFKSITNKTPGQYQKDCQ